MRDTSIILSRIRASDGLIYDFKDNACEFLINKCAVKNWGNGDRKNDAQQARR